MREIATAAFLQSPDTAPETAIVEWQPQDTISEIAKGFAPFIDAVYPHNIREEELVLAINGADVIPAFIHAAYALNRPGRRPGRDGYSNVIASEMDMSLRVDMGESGLLTGHGGNVRHHPYQYSLCVPFQRTADRSNLFVAGDTDDLLPNACVINTETGEVLIFGYQNKGIGELAPGQRGSDPMAVLLALQCLAHDTSIHLQGVGGDVIQDRFDSYREQPYIPLSEF
jgi:hypothetical protein